jgi:hypothetical protein
MSVRIDVPASRGIGVTVAAVGGALAGLVYLGLLTVIAMRDGHGPATGANALGAWAVRWLQSAAPQALDNPYPDATLGGIFIVLIVGALFGALLAALLGRLPDDHPMAWGLLLGLVLWWLVLRSLAPALDPVLLTVVDARGLFVAHLVSGGVLGAWLHAARHT